MQWQIPALCLNTSLAAIELPLYCTFLTNKCLSDGISVSNSNARPPKIIHCINSNQEQQWFMFPCSGAYEYICSTSWTVSCTSLHPIICLTLVSPTCIIAGVWCQLLCACTRTIKTAASICKKLMLLRWMHVGVLHWAWCNPICIEQCFIKIQSSDELRWDGEKETSRWRASGSYITLPIDKHVVVRSDIQTW